MSEKARGALFNMLGDIEGLSVLDAFAGSGALSIEAISRGASSAVAIDVDKRAYRALTENIESLQLEDKIQAIRANSSTWAKNTDDMYDLVLLDPPYDDINPLHLYSLAERVLSGGLLVLSIPDHFRPRFDAKEWDLVSTKKYAAANVLVYRRV